MYRSYMYKRNQKILGSKINPHIYRLGTSIWNMFLFNFKLLYSDVLYYSKECSHSHQDYSDAPWIVDDIPDHGSCHTLTVEEEPAQHLISKRDDPIMEQWCCWLELIKVETSEGLPEGWILGFDQGKMIWTACRRVSNWVGKKWLKWPLATGYLQFGLI